MQNYVLVLDTNKQPLSPCHPATAPKLLRAGKAAVFRRYPFTISLNKSVPDAQPQPVQLKIDPGAKTTGLALVQDDRVIWAAELEHRGAQIKKALADRRAVRRKRRQRKTRYRAPRFLNRTRSKGWLPPSLKSRVANLQTWLTRLSKLAPISAVSMELVRFDTQLLQDAEVAGVEYQQGELAGYEVREYLLEKFGRQSIYCKAEHVPLDVEHINPRSRGGSNRVSNLTIACKPCNRAKGNQTAAEFGHPQVQAQAKTPLKDAAAVNSVRWAIWRMLSETGFPVEVGTGGRTKFNRVQKDYPKMHWIDAACVGESGAKVYLLPVLKPLLIRATGHGVRQMCRTDQYGFPVAHKARVRQRFGWRTGDLASAQIPLLASIRWGVLSPSLVPFCLHRRGSGGKAVCRSILAI